MEVEEEEEVGLVGQEGMDKEATAKAVKVEVTGKVSYINPFAIHKIYDIKFKNTFVCFIFVHFFF